MEEYYSSRERLRREGTLSPPLSLPEIRRRSLRRKDSQLTPHERQAIVNSFRTSIWGNPYDHRASLHTRRKSALVSPPVHDPLSKRISQASLVAWDQPWGKHHTILYPQSIIAQSQLQLGKNLDLWSTSDKRLTSSEFLASNFLTTAQETHPVMQSHGPISYHFVPAKGTKLPTATLQSSNTDSLGTVAVGVVPSSGDTPRPTSLWHSFVSMITPRTLEAEGAGADHIIAPPQPGACLYTSFCVCMSVHCLCLCMRLSMSVPVPVCGFWLRTPCGGTKPHGISPRVIWR